MGASVTAMRRCHQTGTLWQLHALGIQRVGGAFVRCGSFTCSASPSMRNRCSQRITHQAVFMGLLSFLFGCGDKEPPYHKRDGQWYFQKTPLTIVSDASVTPLAPEFANIDGAVYYRSTKIDSAEHASFTVLDKHYAKDATHVYWCDTYRKGQDYYLIKYDRVFTIDGADAASFDVLSQDYARDTRRVYYEGESVRGADAATFEVLEIPYARDAQRGYFHRAPIVNSDGRSFVVVSTNFAKDSTHVFYSRFDTANVPQSVVIPGAQPATFVALDFGYASDSGHQYYDATILSDAKLPLIVFETSGYARIGTVVYYRGARVPGADGASFALRTMPSSDSGDAFDAHQWYESGKVFDKNHQRQ